MKRLRDSKILVTGASGFIGSRLILKLLSLDAKIYGISRKEQKGNKGIFWFKGDLSNLDFVEKLITEVQPDYIFHLASHVLGSRDMSYVLSTFNSNLITTINILIAIQKIPCKRLVLTGSLEEGISNKLKIIPSSPYAAAKIGAANYARMFHKLYKTPVCIASLYMVYGPGQKDLLKLVPYVILKLLKGESPEISSGVRKIDWIYVDDVVSGLIQMLFSSNIDGKTIDIGSGKAITTKKFVTLLSELVNSKVKPIFGAIADRRLEQEKKANIVETKGLIGWQPQTKLKKGLLKTIEYYSN